MVRKIGLPLAALGMLLLAVYHVVLAQQQPPKMEPPVQPARSPFGSGVAGAGLVEARTENIAVGAYLPGIVTRVSAKVGQKVKKGDLLFKLDDRALLAERLVKKRQLASMQAQLDKLTQMPRKEELPALAARLAEAKANLTDQDAQLQRARKLFLSRAIGEEERSRREMAAATAREQMSRAVADLDLMKAGVWGPDRKIAEAGVEMAKAQLAQTETELERLEVRALIDGEVLQVNVRPGEFVGTQPNLPLIVLGDLGQLHVRVDVDEHDIPRFKVGAKGRATLRGDPATEMHLRFVRVEPYVIPKRSLTGDNTERVDTRVLQVIYALPEKVTGVYVGQQVDVYMDGE